MAKYLFLKNVDREAVLKVISDGDGTIQVPLSAFARYDQEVPADPSKLEVTIREIEWSGEPDGIIRIKRGGERIMSLQSAPQGLMQFEGQQMCAENHNANQDFEFEMVGTCEAWLLVRKHGYLQKNGETASYGVYDDPNIVGPRQDIPVVPDYTKQ